MFFKVTLMTAVLAAVSLNASAQQTSQDNPDKHGEEVRTYTYSKTLEGMVRSDTIFDGSAVMIAFPNASKQQQNIIVKKLETLAPSKRLMWNNYVFSHGMTERIHQVSAGEATYKEGDKASIEPKVERSSFSQKFSAKVLDAMLAEGKNPTIFTKSNLLTTMEYGQDVNSQRNILGFLDAYASLLKDPKNSYKGRPAFRYAAIGYILEQKNKNAQSEAEMITRADAEVIYDRDLDQCLFSNEGSPSTRIVKATR